MLIFYFIKFLSLLAAGNNRYVDYGAINSCFPFSSIEFRAELDGLIEVSRQIFAELVLKHTLVLLGQ